MSWIEDYLKRISYQESKEFLLALSKSEYFIITDKNLESLYQKELFPKHKYYSIEPGENSKTLQQVNEILEILLELNYSRKLIIIGFGGGVVGDIAGFISAIYKRGCRLALMPTSLIAMVDASVGGKNGVNSLNYKNQFGTIKQPEYINFDFNLLNTLPQSEISNGIPEIIKHGLIFSADYYQKVKSLDFEFADYSMTKLAEIIKESISIKLSFVNGDENDNEQRRFLNFGHTLGHVVEKLYNIGHGKAVLWGMIQALKLSYRLNLIPASLCQALLKDLDKVNIVNSQILEWEEISKALASDKKREGENITFVLLEGLGKPVIRDVKLEIIEQLVIKDDADIFRNN